MTFCVAPSKAERNQHKSAVFVSVTLTSINYEQIKFLNSLLLNLILYLAETI